MGDIVKIGDATRIYALVDFDTGHPWYVGKTVQSLRAKLVAHKRAALRGDRRPVCQWIRDTRAIAIKWLETVPHQGDWAERERHWIAELRRGEPDAMNRTDGGEGFPGLVFSDSHRLRISEALKRGAMFDCLECGSEFWRKPYAIKMGQNKFCSRGCYQAWQVVKKKDNSRGLMGVAGREAALRARRNAAR